jgi:hypothetical protein
MVHANLRPRATVRLAGLRPLGSTRPSGPGLPQESSGGSRGAWCTRTRGLVPQFAWRASARWGQPGPPGLASHTKPPIEAGEHGAREPAASCHSSLGGPPPAGERPLSRRPDHASFTGSRPGPAWSRSGLPTPSRRTFASGIPALRSLGGVGASPSGLRLPPTPSRRDGQPLAALTSAQEVDPTTPGTQRPQAAPHGRFTQRLGFVPRVALPASAGFRWPALQAGSQRAAPARSGRRPRRMPAHRAAPARSGRRPRRVPAHQGSVGSPLRRAAEPPPLRGGHGRPEGGRPQPGRTLASSAAA